MTAIREFNYPASISSGSDMRRALDEDGIFIARGVISPDEADELRQILLRHLPKRGLRYSLGRTQPNAAEKVPELDFIFSHPRILRVVSEVLGEANVVFTGHCDIHMNMLSGWHKDSGEAVPGGYFTGPYMTSPDCRVYKVAIYLQDTGPRDGFTARLGSHRQTDLAAGEKISAQSKVGDIVVFDVRLTHTGQLPDMAEKGIKGLSRLANRGRRDRQDPAWISNLKSTYWRIIGRRDRLSVFFTYGAPNQFTYDFAQANMSRQARQGAAGGTTGLSPQLRKSLEAKGVSHYEAPAAR